MIESGGSPRRGSVRSGSGPEAPRTHQGCPLDWPEPGSRPRLPAQPAGRRQRSVSSSARLTTRPVKRLRDQPRSAHTVGLSQAENLTGQCQKVERVERRREGHIRRPPTGWQPGDETPAEPGLAGTRLTRDQHRPPRVRENGCPEPREHLAAACDGGLCFRAFPDFSSPPSRRRANAFLLRSLLVAAVTSALGRTYRHQNRLLRMCGIPPGR